MINYYSKYLKYKNKYLKLKELTGGTEKLHNEYTPKKINVEMNVLNDFFKEFKFTDQEQIRELFFEKTDEDKMILLDQIYSANEDLFCVFIKILNSCTDDEDNEKYDNSLKKLANSDEKSDAKESDAKESDAKESDPEEKYKNFLNKKKILKKKIESLENELGIGDPYRRMIQDDSYNKKSKEYNEVNNESDKLMLNNPDEAKRYNEEMEKQFKKISQ
jgi:hypothetical protein